MPRPATARAAGTLLAGALLAGGVSQPTAAAGTTTDELQPFTVHSGDACRMGVAQGAIVWHQPPTGRTVDGQATVSDRPVPNGAWPGCGDDGRYSVLMMTAFDDSRQVAQQIFAADNGSRGLLLALSARTPVELVVVQVCRSSRSAGPAPDCGTAQSFRAPVRNTG